MDKQISKNQILRLLDKGSTVKLKGFKNGSKKLNGQIVFNEIYELELQENEEKPVEKDRIICPSCKIGTVLKGQKAYGCSRWKAGCAFRYAFEKIRTEAAGRVLTKELVLSIISGG